MRSWEDDLHGSIWFNYMELGFSEDPASNIH